MVIPNSQGQNPICLVYDEELDILVHGCQGGYFIPLDALLFIQQKLNNTIDFANNNDVNLLNNPQKERVRPKRDKDISPKIYKPTRIYVMLDWHTGYHKIGRSKSPFDRERTLQSEKPTIELLFYFEATEDVETKLHNIFDNKRVRGEWFNLTDEDIQYIKQLGDITTTVKS